MISAGIPIIQCLNILIKSSNHLTVINLIQQIKIDIQNGIKLSQAFEKHSRYFNQLYCSLIAAGEESGTLAVMLERLAHHLEKMASIKRKIKKAIFYPATVFVVGIVISAILLLKVIPEFKNLFASFNSTLPTFTLAVLAISAWVQNYLYFLIIGIVAVLSNLYWLTKRSVSFRHWIDCASLKLPILGPLLVKSILARFAQTLATTFVAGIPLVTALKIVAKTANNSRYARAITQVQNKIIEGKSFYHALETEKIFPAVMLQMIGIGEESGELDNMLNKTATLYEEEVDHIIDILNSLIEPAIMIVLGILVGGLVIAMYLPIFQLSNVVAK
jgi:type IV pilus assembly protein PilC